MTVAKKNILWLSNDRLSVVHGIFCDEPLILFFSPLPFSIPADSFQFFDFSVVSFLLKLAKVKSHGVGKTGTGVLCNISH